MYDLTDRYETGNSVSVKIWRLATIMQVSSLHACVDNFHPPGAGDATETNIYVSTLHSMIRKQLSK